MEEIQRTFDARGQFLAARREVSAEVGAELFVSPWSLNSPPQSRESCARREVRTQKSEPRTALNTPRVQWGAGGELREARSRNAGH
jgi:hypothetical protein